MTKLDPHCKWWTDKINRYGLKAFGPSSSRWATHVLARLCVEPGRQVTGDDVTTLSQRLGVSRKYFSRAAALLTRFGLVDIVWRPQARIRLLEAQLLRRKNRASKVREKISQQERAAVLRRDGNRCGHCGRRFPAEQLEIDHIIPAALRGADHPGNWVALCRAHNRAKRDRISPGFLRYYGGKVIRGSVGVRFRGGAFWPFIEGWTRLQRRMRNAGRFMQSSTAGKRIVKSVNRPR